MKNLLIFPLVSLLVSLPLQAAEEHQHGAGETAEPATQHGAMMGMMNQEQMANMQKHMQEMQTMMAAIKQETDPAKREKLLQQHMANMSEAMKSMGGGMMGMSGKGGTTSMSMDERMGMMQNQMGMMHMMMEQMMQHFSQEQHQH